MLHVITISARPLSAYACIVQDVSDPRRRTRPAALTTSDPPNAAHAILDTGSSTAGAWGGDSPAYARGVVMSGVDSCVLAHAPPGQLMSAASVESSAADSTGAISGGSTPFGTASDQVLLEGQQVSDPWTSVATSSRTPPSPHPLHRCCNCKLTYSLPH